MLHLLLYGALAIVLAGLLFAVAARFLPAGEQIAPSVRDEPPWELPPDRALRPDEVDSVRLPVALRGYRFAETDILLDRLADELRARDAEIERLQGNVPPPYTGEEERPEPRVQAPAEPDEQLEEQLAVEADIDDVHRPGEAARPGAAARPGEVPRAAEPPGPDEVRAVPRSDGAERWAAPANDSAADDPEAHQHRHRRP